jgi:hypothetical protein
MPRDAAGHQGDFVGQVHHEVFPATEASGGPLGEDARARIVGRFSNRVLLLTTTPGHSSSPHVCNFADLDSPGELRELNQPKVLRLSFCYSAAPGFTGAAGSPGVLGLSLTVRNAVSGQEMALGSSATMRSTNCDAGAVLQLRSGSGFIP